MSFLHRFKAGTEAANRSAVIVGFVCIVFLFVLTAADVFMRLLLNSIPGVIDIATYLLVPIGFIGLGYAQLQGKHVSADFLVTRFSSNLRRAVDIINLLLMISVTVILTWFVLKQGLSDWQTGVLHYGTIRIPVWTQSFVALIGCAGLLFALLAQLVQKLISPIERVA